MDTIKTYLDNMFLGVTETEDVKRLKSELYANMCEKYSELKAAGKSENEAIGVVISEFGNIEELISELGVSRQSPDQNAGLTVSRAEAEEFVAKSEKSGILTAIGVFLCINCPTPLILLAGLSDPEVGGGIIPEKNAALFGLLFLFVCVAIGVGLFIGSGNIMERFKKFSKEPLVLDPALKSSVASEKSKFIAKYNIYTVIGVIMYIISSVPLITVALTVGEENNMLVLVCVAVLLLIVASATAMFCKEGNVKSAFDALLQEDDFTLEKKKAVADELSGAISGAFWTLTTALYLLASFATERWELTWIIWVIAAGIYGIIRAVLIAVSKDRK